MARPYVITLLFFSFHSISFLFAQTAGSDSNFYHSAVQNFLSLYNSTLRENTHLYNGAEYIEAHPEVSGSPFWGATTFQAGSIYYDGVFYPALSLAYDAVKEEVVIKNQQRISIKLPTEKIDYFTLSDQLFIHITSDTIDNSDFKSGFYNVIYEEGGITVLAKRAKVALRVLVPNDHYEFTVKENYFIKKDEKYYTITDKSSLLNSLEDRKKELKEFFRKNKFEFKREDFENAIIKTADYYNQLKK